MMVLFFFLAALFQLSDCRLKTINTDDGALTGYNIPVPQNLTPDLQQIGKAQSIDVFLGIPYAKPPVGDLRFARPVPVTPWSVWNATYYRPPCIQTVDFLRRFDFPNLTENDVSEDCLYLNIYAPKFNTSTLTSDQQLPVMVWIHGGAYTYGSAIEYDGRVMSTYGAVIVTVNYRVGVMGYLSTDDDVAPGNVGMLDQVEALKWVQRNIRYFGGNPNRVTIFGQSSGGSTVSMHMFSPLTKGLFHGVIAQSGVATDTFAIYRPPYTLLNTTKSLAAAVQCPLGDSKTIVNCLRKTPAMSLAKAKLENTPPMSAPWVPRVDGYYLKDLPDNLLARGDIHRLPLIAGSVTCETGADYTFVPGIEKGVSEDELLNLYKKHCERYGSQANVMLEAILCEYGGKPNDPVGNRQRLFQFMSYYEYIAGIYRLLNPYSKENSNVWLYSYNYRSVNQPSPKYWGTFHAIELQYMLGLPIIGNFSQPWTWHSVWPGFTYWTSADKIHSRKLITIWTNFAKTLDPNNGEHISVNWLPYDEGNKSYMFIDKVSSLRHNQNPQDVQFWNDFVPRVMNGSSKPSECPAKHAINPIGR